jgi:hypothetical protein
MRRAARDGTATHRDKGGPAMSVIVTAIVVGFTLWAGVTVLVWWLFARESGAGK